MNKSETPENCSTLVLIGRQCTISSLLRLAQRRYRGREYSPKARGEGGRGLEGAAMWALKAMGSAPNALTPFGPQTIRHLQPA